MRVGIVGCGLHGAWAARCLAAAGYGALAPSLAGMAADSSDLSAPLWIMVGLAIAGGLCALGLRETAPRKRAQRMARSSALSEAAE